MKSVPLSFVCALVFCALVLAFVCAAASPALSQRVDEPFTFPANAGYTGLMEIPTARVMGEERWRAGVSYIEPLWHYYGTLSPLKGLEVNARINKVEGYPALLSGYGDLKDKAVDIKYQVVSEGKYRPALALGFLDPHGTRLFGAQFLVASKQIYPFDFTIGYGDGRFGDRPLPRGDGEGFKFDIFTDPDRWLKEGRFFYGIQFVPSERFALMVEYSPVDHDRQASGALRDYFRKNPTSSKWNLGLRWKPFHWATVDLSWQRGNQVGLALSTEFDFGRPFIPLYDHPYRELPEHRRDPLEERLIRALYESGFSDIGVALRRDALWIDAQNDAWFFTPRALRVVLDLVADIAPSSVEDVHIILKHNGIPQVRLTTLLADVVDLKAGALTVNQFFYLAEMRTDSLHVPKGDKEHRRSVDYGIRPMARFFLNDPSGFFKYRLGVGLSARAMPLRGMTIVTGVSTFPLNTVSTSNVPPGQAVRSDSVPYLEEEVILDRLMVEQIVKTPCQVYLRGAAGILEIQYAGFDGEIALPLFDGRILVGASGSLVKKREPGELLSLKKNPNQDSYRTAFFNARLNIPEQDVWIDLKAGRFLAGDKGTRVSVSKFYNGLTLSAWYGVTDTDMFRDNANRGYKDKGISLSIPLRFFKGADSRTTYGFALAPWTRDVAQDISHLTPLFDYIGRNVNIYLDKDRGKH